MNAKATSVVSTKGGVGKSTTAANLGAFCADAGIRTLLIDLDPVQPSLSSYYELPEVAQGGIYDLLAANITDPARIISRTIIPNLDVVISNDQNNQLNNLLLQAPDGRLRLANLMPALKEGYDLVLIDTQGARSALLEMVVLASDLVVSPSNPTCLPPVSSTAAPCKCSTAYAPMSVSACGSPMFRSSSTAWTRPMTPGQFTRMCVPSSMSIRTFLCSKRLSRMPSCFATQHRAGYQRTASKRGNPPIAHQRPRWKSFETWPSRSFPSGLTASWR